MRRREVCRAVRPVIQSRPSPRTSARRGGTIRASALHERSMCRQSRRCVRTDCQRNLRRTCRGWVSSVNPRAPCRPSRSHAFTLPSTNCLHRGEVCPQRRPPLAPRTSCLSVAVAGQSPPTVCLSRFRRCRRKTSLRRCSSRHSGRQAAIRRWPCPTVVRRRHHRRRRHRRRRRSVSRNRSTCRPLCRTRPSLKVPLLPPRQRRKSPPPP
jgi:hypothetical protein